MAAAPPHQRVSKHPGALGHVQDEPGQRVPGRDRRLLRPGQDVESRAHLQDQPRRVPRARRVLAWLHQEWGTAIDVANPTAAHVWAPVVASLGPALLQEAQNALDYSESMVADWLARWMMAAVADPVAAGKKIAHHFNDASKHKSHGRRIDRDEAAKSGVVVEHLQDNQALQEAVLTSYHVMTVAFEASAIAKMLYSDVGRSWFKNVNVPQAAPQP